MSATAATEQTFTLPDLGEGLVDAEVLAWLVEEGDAVAVDQPLVNMLTAKAEVEVPSPFAGVVTRRHANVGEVVAVGGPLVTIAPPAPEGDSGQVLVGYGTGGQDRATTGRRRRRRPASGAGAPRASEEPGVGAPGGAPRAPVARPARIPAVGHILTTPPIRKLARARGVDLASVTGSGPGGRITRSDVDHAGGAADDVERIPLTGLRRAVAERLARSRREIPDASTWVDVDATRLVALKAELAAHAPDAGIGMLALVARAVVIGLGRFPDLNAHVEDDVVVRHRRVHLGIAAQTPRGLVVPVVRDAHLRTTSQLASEIRRLTTSARDGHLPPHELTGGTFTLNNYGVFGVDGSTPIINAPEVALLGLGRLLEKPWVVDGQLAVRSVTQLSLTFDHRVCDGGVAGGFLRFIADCIEAPSLLVAHA